MNRTIAGLAVAATAATLLTAAPAQAAPIDPGKALKGQLVAGRGMTFTEATKINGPGFNIVFSRRTGTMQFAPSGPVAADMTGKINLPTDDLPEDAEDGQVQAELEAAPGRTAAPPAPDDLLRRRRDRDSRGQADHRFALRQLGHQGRHHQGAPRRRGDDQVRHRLRRNPRPALHRWQRTLIQR